MIRTEQFGDRGGPEMARRLGIPIRTWYNYEGGVTVPAEVLLRFIEQTGVEVLWLLHGRGPKFRRFAPSTSDPGDEAPDSARALLRRALELLEDDGAFGEDHGLGAADDRGPEADRELPDDLVLLRVEDLSPGDRAEATPSPSALLVERDRIDDGRRVRCLRVRGDAMAPLLADGALVGYDEVAEATEQLDGDLVVAPVNGRPIVRRLLLAGRIALLRAENPDAEPAVIPIDLDADAADELRFRRVLWSSTPHGSGSPTAAHGAPADSRSRNAT